MGTDDKSEVIRDAAAVGITLTRADIERIDGDLFVDGMDPYDWLDAMTMD